MFNGSIVQFSFGFCQKEFSFVKGKGAFHRIIPELAKYLMLAQNLVVPRQTLNTPHEVIETVYKDKLTKQTVYKLGYQKTNLIFDLVAEPYGFNRMEKESVEEYIARLLRDDHLYTRTDYSFHEFVPKHTAEINSKLSTHDHTYYFSVSTSLRGTRIKTKAKEGFKEP